jgi:hypothetical protein
VSLSLDPTLAPKKQHQIPCLESKGSDSMKERKIERERELARCDLTPLLDLHEKEIWLLLFFHGFHRSTASSPTNGKEQ